MAEAEAVKGAKKEEAAGAPPLAKKGKGLLIAIIGAAVIAAGAGGFALMKMRSSPAKEGRVAEEAPAEGRSKEKGLGDQSQVFKLDPFIVNLQDNSGTRYLKITLNLELVPATQSTELEANVTKIRDSLIVLLSSKNYADIGTVEGKYQLRDEIVARVNQFLSKGKVKTAYFTDFVVQ
ncbi:MAG: flagellar basal body-associated FliL family protein [Deltaproteobacteria bacterium]|nr:flagellar basal body-associated FliL family protein [Deltaproteobacteria bacterium]